MRVELVLSLRCWNCAHDVAYVETARKATCPRCGNVLIVRRDAGGARLGPRLRIVEVPHV